MSFEPETMPLKQVVAALNGEGAILKERVFSWMRESDIKTRGAVYVLTNRAWARINPELSMKEQCRFMADYLIECLVTDPKEGQIDSPRLPGRSRDSRMAEKHLHGIPGANVVIGGVAEQLTLRYRQADQVTRNRIETSCLEHIFENRSLRTFFVHWREDPELNEAFDLCAAWGEAHLDE